MIPAFILGCMLTLSLPHRFDAFIRHRCVPERLEQKPEALCLDCNRRVNHRETFPLSTNSGEDPARLH